MNLSGKSKLTALIASALMSAATLTAENPTVLLPGQHQQQHGDLLADQGNASIQLDNATKYLESLFSEEEEPEYDIYTEGWESNRVNCYADAVVPQTAVINVSKFSMPHPGYITSPYGYRRRFRRMHKGVDLKVNIGDATPCEVISITMPMPFMMKMGTESISIMLKYRKKNKIKIKK